MGIRKKELPLPGALEALMTDGYIARGPGSLVEFLDGPAAASSHEAYQAKAE